MSHCKQDIMFAKKNYPHQVTIKSLYIPMKHSIITCMNHLTRKFCGVMWWNGNLQSSIPIHHHHVVYNIKTVNGKSSTLITFHFMFCLSATFNLDLCLRRFSTTIWKCYQKLILMHFINSNLMAFLPWEEQRASVLGW